MRSSVDCLKWKNSCALLACLALLLLSVSPGHAADKALVVGINEYSHGIPPLGGCVNDADNMARILSARGFEVKSILNQEATRARILEELKRLTNGAASGDSIVFFYSGHGSFFPDKDSPVQDEKFISFEIAGKKFEGCFDQALVPVDTNEKPTDNPSRVWKNYILDDELYEIFNPAAARGASVLFISDSCFSGSIGKDALDGGLRPIKLKAKDGYGYYPGARIWVDLALLKRGSSSGARSLASGGASKGSPENLAGREGGVGSYVSVTGCSDEQMSYEWSTAEGKKMGAMTSVLVELLGKESNPAVGRTISYLKEQVSKRSGGPQTPHVVSYYGGLDVERPLFRLGFATASDSTPGSNALPAVVTIKVLDVVNNEPVSEGELSVGGRSFEIANGTVKVPRDSFVSGQPMTVRAAGYRTRIVREMAPDKSGVITLPLVPELTGP